MFFKIVKTIYLFLVIGFVGCHSDPVENPELPNPGKWEMVSEYASNAVHDGVSFQIGEYAYCGLGKRDESGRLPGEFYKTKDGYDWQKITFFPGDGRTGAIAFALNGKGYVGLGHSLVENSTSEKQFYKDLWCYDPATDQWNPAPEFIGEAREGAVAFVLNQQGADGTWKQLAFVGGGITKDDCQNDYYSFDGTSWEKVKIPLGSKRYGGTAFVVGNTAYVCGGYRYVDAQAPERETELVKDMVYCRGGKSLLWGIIKDGFAGDSLPRAFATSFSLWGKGYLLSGISDLGEKTYNRTFWEFDPVAQQWTKIAGLLPDMDARLGALAFALQDNGFLLFGQGQKGLCRDVWRFSLKN